ncbi:Kae1-associated serine/threonine protein kinase [Candidatus Woesearchaeota archaeon]|nr:Kae1-associated serine/threonine protein kinase [Candidatus Woesearchaeota archaeon]
MRKILSSGAEAVIYKNDISVIKDRVRKSYRIKEIDETLRRTRTRREAKVLQKLAEINFPAPRLISTDDRKMHIHMEYIKGDVLKETFDQDHKRFSEEIGKKVAILHNNGIIHGDLTTSNMISRDGIVFIDFGLSFFSKKYEDKAVDLHLLKQALESKHWRVFDEAFDIVKRSYSANADDAGQIMQRFEEVEARGRYKGKH